MVDLAAVADPAKLVVQQPASVSMLHVVGVVGALLEMVLVQQHHLQRAVDEQVQSQHHWNEWVVLEVH